MSKSASLPIQPFDDFDPHSNESAAATSAWKQEVNQKLAAHRNRRGASQENGGSREAQSPRTASARAAEAAARVAARYAKAPSYSQLLAGEARAVVLAAGAAAEAARSAQAAAQAVLEGLESAPIASGLWEPAEEMVTTQTTHAPAQARWHDEPPAQSQEQPGARLAPWAGAQPRWEEALPASAPVSALAAGRDVWSDMRVHPSSDIEHTFRKPTEQHYRESVGDGELFPDETFDPYESHDPMSHAMVEPVQHLPANLIEFPRELVATRKARPRLAEGPFYNASHENSQLSIFEVDPDSLDSQAYANDTKVAPPEWASIELDHHREGHLLEDRAAHAYSTAGADRHVIERHVYAAEIPADYAHVGGAHLGGATASAVEEMPHESVVAPPVHNPVKVEPSPEKSRNSVAAPVAEPVSELLVATLSDRLLAAVVDGALVTLAFLAAAVVVIASTAHPPTGRVALIASGCGLLLFGLLYQFLFLSYAEEGTPGMRYARIALCTFDDDNPTLEQMRKRILALLLAALPAGLGLAWALFDKDHLGWHDRMTKTYQRKY